LLLNGLEFWTVHGFLLQTLIKKNALFLVKWSFTLSMLPSRIRMVSAIMNLTSGKGVDCAVEG
jgi:hypothetical protein